MNEPAPPDPLWLTEARYRAIVEDQPDLVCRFRPDGTLTFVNTAYCTFFGLRREDVIGKRYQPVVHPDDLPEVQAKVATLSVSNQVVYIENRVFRADGAIRWTEWTNRGIYDESGQLLELQSAGRDVTERRRGEDDTARLAAIVASADAAIYSTTLDGVITSWNRAAERMFGYTTDEALGQRISLIIPPNTPSEALDIPNRVRRGETIEHIETEKQAKGGRRIPISLTVSPIKDAKGRVVGISRIARDISERKRVERDLQERETRFRLMADHAPVLIWIADTANMGVYFNKPWVEFTGVPLDAQLGDGWLSLIHPEDRARAGAFCQDHFERRQPFTMEFRLRHHSGGYRWVQDTGQPLFLADGTFNGYIGSCLDIQERKTAEDRIRTILEDAVQRESDARAAAEEASRLKDEFLAVVSHELRTPLNAVLGWAKMLRDGSVAPSAIPKALETIERNARVQTQLIEDLLDVSRIARGDFSLRHEPVSLGEVVGAAVDAVRPAAAGKQIDLRTDVAEDAITVTGDAGRLQQAVWNLLVNAIKFTPRKGRVDVSLTRRGEDAVVAVRDTGSGIPREALAVIFDRFRQADGRTTRAHGGLGLGLTIVEHIILAHGGDVRADSGGAGQGATFEIVLPTRTAAAAQRRSSPPVQQRPDFAGRRVLVVDDDRDSLDLVRAILEKCGADVATASSVSEALAVAQGAEPELVISDIGMPDQDGYDLIRLLRSIEQHRRIPAVALTAYSSAEHRDAALRAGFDGHLAKPVDPETLCGTIADLWRDRSQPA